MPESLCNLYCLQHLNLSYNFGLRGWIPEGLGDLVNLKTLHLYSALLTGKSGWPGAKRASTQNLDASGAIDLCRTSTLIAAR